MVKFVHGWQELPFSRKLYMLGLIMATVSPFLPWFSDSNEFVQGSLYLGLTGPASFLGLSIFVLSVGGLIQETFYLWKDKLLFGETVATWIYNGLAVFNLYLLGLASSVLLHPAVGSNLLAKHFLWGFYLSAGTYVVLLLGLVLSVPSTTKRGQKTKSNTRAHQPIKQQAKQAEIDPDRKVLRTLKIEDVVPQANLNQNLRNRWDQQRELENKIENQEDNNVF